MVSWGLSGVAWHYSRNKFHAEGSKKDIYKAFEQAKNIFSNGNGSEKGIGLPEMVPERYLVHKCPIWLEVSHKE